VRKLIAWLTTRTAAGELFDIDTALRPNGNSGLLVTSMTSFENYQTGRGSNTAWTWEHQALTRARWCAGIERLAPRFEAVRRAVLAAPRDLDALLDQVRAMREKVRAAHPVKAGRFDLKHSAGGMIDVEFAVQASSWPRRAPRRAARRRRQHRTAARAEDAGLVPAGVGVAAADAYRDLRRAQHRARLDEQPTQVDPPARRAEQRRRRALACSVRLTAAAPGARSPARSRSAPWWGSRWCQRRRSTGSPRSQRASRGAHGARPSSTTARSISSPTSPDRAGRRARSVRARAWPIAAAWLIAWPLTQLGLLARPDLVHYGGLSASFTRASRASAGGSLRTSATNGARSARSSSPGSCSRSRARRPGRAAASSAGLGHCDRADRARQRLVAGLVAALLCELLARARRGSRVAARGSL
jgi:hypothetical protein